MPTFNAAAQGNASCRSFAAQMDAFFRDRKPDLVILSADWLEYARPPRFDGMIADLKQTISRLNGLGIRRGAARSRRAVQDPAAVDADARASAARRCAS